MMPRLLTLAIATAALANAGCVAIHAHSGRDLPGDSQVRNGLVAPKGRAVTSRDPGETDYIVEVAVHAGGGGDVAATPKGSGFGGFNLELSGIKYESSESHRETLISKAMEKQKVRPVLGWQFARIENDKTRTGPVYVEAKYEIVFEKVAPALSIGGGVAFDWRGVGIGPQATACLEPMVMMGGVCLRATQLFGRGTDLYIAWMMKGFLEYSESK